MHIAASAAWQAGDVPSYDVSHRERTLGAISHVSEMRMRLTLAVVDIASGGAPVVDLRQDACVVLASAASETHGARGEEAARCAVPVRVHVADDTDAVRIDDIESSRARVRAHAADAFADFDATADSTAQAFIADSIAQLGSEAAIVTDTREYLRLVRVPPGLLPASFSDTRPGPLDEAPALWTQVIEWLPPEAAGQRRARWRMTPDPDVVRATVRARWNAVFRGEVSKASTPGRALAGDFDMSVTTDYSFDVAGRVVHALTVQESRFADRHARRERAARLRTSP